MRSFYPHVWLNAHDRCSSQRGFLTLGKYPLHNSTFVSTGILPANSYPIPNDAMLTYTVVISDKNQSSRVTYRYLR
jgi:hypothetical protein